MDPNIPDVAVDGESIDIQSYLTRFNKEISTGGQDFVLQQGDGTAVSFSTISGFVQNGQQVYTTTGGDQQGDATLTVVQAEDGTTQLVMSSPVEDQPQVKGEDTGNYVHEVENTLEQGGGDLCVPGQTTEEASNSLNVLGIQPKEDDIEDVGNAVQVLASVAASSIPHVQSDEEEELTVGQADKENDEPQQAAVQSDVVTNQNSSVVISSGDVSQTVTIVPSNNNANGEVSYVLIVSQDENGKKMENGDMSVYDFEDKMTENVNEDGTRDTPRRVIRFPSKRVSSGMHSQLMCNYCNYTSPKRYLLTRHMKIHSEERPHKCNICDKAFKSVSALQNHINTHTGVRPHKCKECDSAFTTSGELVRHVRYRHTFEKPHRCTECDYCSVELSKLRRHMRSHTGERPYQCPHCSYASPDTFKLKRHLRIHTGEKPYECDICRARFTQSNSLKSHKLIHTGNKPVFQCELCPTTCGRKTDLKIHVQKLHTSDKPLQCRKCGKSFPDRYTYKIHLKTHDGDKCFKCELCPYSALSQRHLESHILTHTGEKPFQCDECEMSFRQKQLLRRHKNLYHNPDYIPPQPREKSHECSECGKMFAHNGNLLRHMALHDPDNPEYQNISMYCEDEDEDYQEEDIGIDEPREEDGSQEIDQPVEVVQVVQPEDDVERPGGESQIEWQLVTENGEQIILQLEGVEDTSPAKEQQVVEEVLEAKPTPVVNPRKRGRPRKEPSGESVPKRPGPGRPPKVAPPPPRVESDEEYVMEMEPDEEESADEEVVHSPVARRSSRQRKPSKVDPDAVQKERNIKECFGFDVDDE